MFDIAFTELVIVAIVALIVIGPEKLPKVARTLGSLVGRMQRYVSTVKQDIERELELDELKRLQQDLQHSAQRLQHEAENTIHTGLSRVEGIGADLTEQARLNEAPAIEPEKRDGSG